MPLGMTVRPISFVPSTQGHKSVRFTRKGKIEHIIGAPTTKALLNETSQMILRKAQGC